MPFLIVHTNAEIKTRDKVRFVEDAAALVASELHKPISYVVVNYNYNPNMSFGGSTGKYGALVEMKSIGFGNKSGLAKILAEFLNDRLEGLDLHSVNIEFVDMPASSLAIGGSLLG